MQRLLAALGMSFILLIMITQAALASAFCDGYKDGYKAGYCYQQFGCIPPIPPICPIPNVGETTYQDGYNRGFIAGLSSRR